MSLRKLHALVILAFLLVSCGSPAAQPSQPEGGASSLEPESAGPAAVDWTKKTPRFENTSIAQGLSQSTVNVMLQDRQGFMWLGTQDGLNRFDGSEFVVYKPEPGNPDSLSNGFVQALYEDPDGLLWIGTFGGGLNRLDPRTEKFTRYLPDPADPQSISSPVVSAIVPAADGTLWIGTNGGGINHFDPKTGRFSAYRHNPRDPYSLSDDVVLNLAVAQDGSVWAGTQSAGLAHLDPKSGKFTIFRHNSEDAGSLGPGSVQALLVDSRQRVWAGTAGGGLSLLEKDRFTHFRYDEQQRYSLSDNNVQEIYEDRDGVLWIGTAQGGLNRYDERRTYSLADNSGQPVYEGRDGDEWAGTAQNGLGNGSNQAGRFIRYQQDAFIPGSLTANNITTIYQDRAGVYWIAVAGNGFDRFDPARIKFRHVFNNPRNINSLLGSVVWSIYKDRNGDLWVSTFEGVTRFREGGNTRRFTNDPHDPRSLWYNQVFSITQDAGGVLWLGTAAGLSRYNSQTDDFTNYTASPVTILRLLVDREGTLWAGTAGNGLARFNRRSGTFTFYSEEPAAPHGMGDDSATSLYEDRSGTLWVGTFAGGLCSFDRQTEEFSCHPYNPQVPGSISDGTVLDMYEDRQGNFWVATGGGGLDLFDRESGTFTAFREQDGLPNDVVYGILEDGQGNLWLSTNNGLSRFNPADKTFRNYTVQDGLQSNEFDQGARFMARDGEMYFGGINGFNSFYPDEIEENEYVPPVVITGFSLFNKPVAPGEGSLLKEAIPFTQRINLQYDQDFFSFDFAALHYSAPEHIQYAYKLEGFDQDWNNAGHRRYAGYTNVPPGDYTFRVRATNSDGLWNENGAALRLVITPPYWQTVWFRILATVLVGAIVLGIFELRLNIVRNQKRQLELQVDERTSELRETMRELQKSKEAAEAANRAKSTFLANVSHELRTPLNAILGFSQLLIRSARPRAGGERSLSSEQLENVKIINQSGEHLLGLINDVLEMSKIEAGRASYNGHSFDLLRMFDGLEDMFRYRAEEKGLKLDMSISPDVPRYVHTDEGKLRQVLMNLLGNAVKYTMEGGIIVDVQAEEHAGEKALEGRYPTHILTFSVSDTGLGIAPRELAGLFKPFTQAASAQKVQEGTGLGLSISRQYAELMGGTLTATSELAHGSTFTLRLPLSEAGISAIRTAPERKALALAPGQETYRILVVDDKAVNRELLCKMLTPMGFEVREAENGRAALEIWDAWAPAAILMDMRMPVMDGYEATRRIKATVKGQATVIIAVTASALEEEREVILSEGCNDYIRKPFHEQEIFEALERHLGLKFVYERAERPGEALQARVPRGSLADQALLLSPGQRENLCKAVTIGDGEEILRQIEAIRPVSPSLADALASLAANYDYERILGLLAH